MAATSQADEVQADVIATDGATYAARRSSAPAAPTARARYRQLALAVAATDAVCVVAALVIAFALRYGASPMPTSYRLTVALAPLVWVAVSYATGLYRLDQLSDWDEFRGTLNATGIAIAVAAVASYWSKSDLSREWIGFGWLIAVAFEFGARSWWRGYIGRLRADNRLALRTAIVGEDADAAELESCLRKQGSGFDPIGYVSIDSGHAPSDAAPILGRLADLDRFSDTDGIECLFVASSAVASAHAAGIARAARQAGVELRMSTSVPDMLISPVGMQAVGGSIAVVVRQVRLTGLQYAAKRAFDLIVSSLLLLLAAPMIAAIGLAVRLTSPGPALFRQTRVTRGGRTFVMLKFRTMRADADAYLAQRGIDPRAPFFKMDRDDPRVTRVGRFLRRSSLDELPQLINVLRGDMSLVGPRPLPAEQVAANLTLLEARHEVNAGLSGWWQIRGRSELDAEESVALDLFYIENWSLGLDIFILVKTAGAILARRGAY